jgi:hypothetical protein
MPSTERVRTDHVTNTRLFQRQQNDQYTSKLIRLLPNNEQTASIRRRFEFNPTKTVHTAATQSSTTVISVRKSSAALLSSTFVSTGPLLFLTMLFAVFLASNGQIAHHKTVEQLHMNHPGLKANRAAAGSKLTTHDVDKMIQNQLTLQQQQYAQQQQHKAGVANSNGKNQQQQRHAKNNEYEKLKRDALIDTFKIKLLKLLDIEKAPNAAEVNIKKEQIPEPIMREYERLMKQSEKPPKRASSSGSGNQLGRKSRDMLNPYSNDAQADMEEEQLSNELEEDQVRFNGSMVQQLTLLPKKCKHFLRFLEFEGY